VSSAPIKVKSSARKSAPARPAKPISKSNGTGRAIAKPASRAVRPGPDRRASEKIVHGGRTAPSAEASGSTSRGKYVYCIIESTDALRFGPIGIGALPHFNQACVFRSGHDSIPHRLGGLRDTSDRLGPAGCPSQRLLKVPTRLCRPPHLHQQRSIQLMGGNDRIRRLRQAVD